MAVKVTNGVDGRTHIIRCELVKDTGRIYRLDSKLKTGKGIKAGASFAAGMRWPITLRCDTSLRKQVAFLHLQAFLKERSIDLDQSCCLIRQAQVTKLADSNSKSSISCMILYLLPPTASGCLLLDQHAQVSMCIHNPFHMLNSLPPSTDDAHAAHT